MSSWLFASVTAASVITSVPFSAGSADDEGAAIYGVKIPPGYADGRWLAWLTKQAASTTYALSLECSNDEGLREGTRPFPDGTIIARLAWKVTCGP